MSEDSPAPVPDAELSAHLAALRAAYRGLAEEQKRALLKQLEKVARLEFDDLVIRAGLDRGGYRTKAIIERRDAHVRARIDEALTREGDEKLLEFVAWHFFDGVRTDFAEVLNEVRENEREALGDEPETDALLALVERRAGDKKGWEFFAAAVRADPEGYIASNEGDAEDEPIEEGATWAQGFDMVERACTELHRCADDLAALRETNFALLTAAVEIAYNVSATLWAKLDAAAAESGFDAPVPADPAGLREYAVALAAHRAGLAASGEAPPTDAPGTDPR